MAAQIFYIKRYPVTLVEFKVPLTRQIEHVRSISILTESDNLQEMVGLELSRSSKQLADKSVKVLVG